MRTPVIGLARWRVFLAFGADVVCQFVRQRHKRQRASPNQGQSMFGKSAVI